LLSRLHSAEAPSLHAKIAARQASEIAIRFIIYDASKRQSTSLRFNTESGQQVAQRAIPSRLERPGNSNRIDHPRHSSRFSSLGVESAHHLFLELTVLHRVVPGRLDLVGRTLAHYKITAAIGAGGMGEVYRATDTKLGREIALKVLPPGMAQDPERLARFRREARSVAALNHPHIVTLHSVEEADGYLFLTMELVEGRPLSRLIPKKGFPVERIFKIALAMAEALAEAHSKGIVHRDLKPSNVMETPEGRVKVLDFGLAKELEAADGTDATLTSADCTRIGDVVGSTR
jgi:serine/threonine protein kinase